MVGRAAMLIGPLRSVKFMITSAPQAPQSELPAVSQAAWSALKPISSSTRGPQVVRK